MVLKRSLYRLLLCAVLFLTTAQVVSAQEPALSSTPQRVSGGVVQSDSVALAMPGIKLHSPIFRDSIPISRMSALSLVLPGFSQLYNKHYWKIPVLYGGVGALGYLAVDANKKYQGYKRTYDRMLEYGVTDRERIDPVQTRMIKYNTQRQLYFVGAACTYLYFLVDGVLNYPNYATPVKKATTLAMIFPGAGQMYNKSYWKVPIVIGAFAAMGYMIDWNSRGYQRFKRAYDLYPNGEFASRGQGYIQNYRENFRRNRDLAIIVTAGVYLLSVVEAHVDAYMKDFDVSENLALRVEPTLIDMSRFYASQNTGYPGVGLALKMNF